MQRIGISLFVNHNAYQGFNQVQQLDQNMLRIEIYFHNPRDLQHYQDGRPDMGQCVDSVISKKNGRLYFIDLFIKGIRVDMALGPNSPLANMSLDLSVEYSSNIHSPPIWQPYPHNPLQVAIGQPPIRRTGHIPNWSVDFKLLDGFQGRYISIYTTRPVDHAFGLGTYYVGGVLSRNQTLFPSTQPQPQSQPQERAMQGAIPPSTQLRPSPANQGTSSRSPQRLRNGIYVGGLLFPNYRTLFPSARPHPRSQPQPQPQPHERAMQGPIPPSIQLRPASPADQGTRSRSTLQGIPPSIQLRPAGPADQGTRSRSTPRLRNGIYDPLLRAYPANQRNNNNDSDNDNDGDSSTVVIKRMIEGCPSSSGSKR